MDAKKKAQKKQPPKKPPSIGLKKLGQIHVKLRFPVAYVASYSSMTACPTIGQKHKDRGS